MKYLDASAILRVLFKEHGPAVPLERGDQIVSSHLIEVETFRAIDRLRLLGQLNDLQTARKRKELGEFLAMMDLIPVDLTVINRAKSPFGVNLRALDALHVASAEWINSEAGTEPFEFWTHDEGQETAAISRGLDVRGIS